MREVGLTTFRADIVDILDNLEEPVALVRYGVPVAVLVPFATYQQDAEVA